MPKRCFSGGGVAIGFHFIKRLLFWGNLFEMQTRLLPAALTGCCADVVPAHRPLWGLRGLNGWLCQLTNRSFQHVVCKPGAQAALLWGWRLCVRMNLPLPGCWLVGEAPLWCDGPLLALPRARSLRRGVVREVHREHLVFVWTMGLSPLVLHFKISVKL